MEDGSCPLRSAWNRGVESLRSLGWLPAAASRPRHPAGCFCCRNSRSLESGASRFCPIKRRFCSVMVDFGTSLLLPFFATRKENKSRHKAMFVSEVRFLSQMFFSASSKMHPELSSRFLSAAHNNSISVTTWGRRRLPRRWAWGGGLRRSHPLPPQRKRPVQLETPLTVAGFGGLACPGWQLAGWGLSGAPVCTCVPESRVCRVTARGTLVSAWPRRAWDVVLST